MSKNLVIIICFSRWAKDSCGVITMSQSLWWRHKLIITAFCDLVSWHSTAVFVLSYRAAVVSVSIRSSTSALLWLLQCKCYSPLLQYSTCSHGQLHRAFEKCIWWMLKFTEPCSKQHVTGKQITQMDIWECNTYFSWLRSIRMLNHSCMCKNLLFNL